jgi:hypothetical protein
MIRLQYGEVCYNTVEEEDREGEEEKRREERKNKSTSYLVP